MTSIDELIERHGEETVQAAFWLQDEIYERGLEAANFSESAEEVYRKLGPLLIKKAIEDELSNSS